MVFDPLHVNDKIPVSTGKCEYCDRRALGWLSPKVPALTCVFDVTDEPPLPVFETTFICVGCRAELAHLQKEIDNLGQRGNRDR